MTGITIIGRDWVSDDTAPGGRKEVITFGVKTAALINNILMLYPRTPDGSFALCLPEGVCRNLIDGVWV